MYLFTLHLFSGTLHVHFDATDTFRDGLREGIKYRGEWHKGEYHFRCSCFNGIYTPRVLHGPSESVRHDD